MTTNQEEKVLSGIAHVAVLFSWLGLVYNLVIYLVYKPKSGFVAGHAKQALGLSIIAILVRMVLGFAFAGAGFAMSWNPMSLSRGYAAGALGGLLMMAVSIAVLIFVILAAVKAFGGEEYRYPVIGSFIAGIGE